MAGLLRSGVNYQPLRKVRNHRLVRPASAPHEAPQQQSFYTVLLADRTLSLMLTPDP